MMEPLLFETFFFPLKKLINHEILKEGGGGLNEPWLHMTFYFLFK